MEAEIYDKLPENIKDVINAWSDDQDGYKECKRVKLELEANGWTCDYDLSAEIFDVAPLGDIKFRKSNSDRFSVPAYYYNGIYYFPEDTIPSRKRADRPYETQGCYYGGGKWKQDSFYITEWFKDQLERTIIGSKAEVIKELGELKKSLIDTEYIEGDPNSLDVIDDAIKLIQKCK